MAEGLFPVYDVPSITVEDEEKQKYYPSLNFDFKTGDFVLDGSGNITTAAGQQAYKQWCIKTILTERYACLAYDSDIGIEMTRILQQPDFEAQCSEIERQYTEALMANPKTEYVREFEFSQPQPDAIAVKFTVKGKEYDEESISFLIKT